ncbi:hypothetical protein [Veronia pacifica]|uniref:Uncharacterized protein n=1 Tax=Veronia pacifica TaxID=1080227 RepID=A0A1C3EE70_9GAMM|nr:hypothetical protein [Veronia pacifica]ODA31525.1 hypothetical protein A8L45_16640 [Veronia pacifica]
MLLATEKKSGESLHGAYSASTLQDFISSFYTPEFMDEFGEPDIELADHVQQIITRKDIRGKISDSVGDPETLLGTTADAVQLLLYGFTGLIAKLHTANSLAEVREAAAPFSELAEGFQNKVSSGEVKLPFQIKGLSSVVEDIEKRATAVAVVLENSSGE